MDKKVTFRDFISEQKKLFNIMIDAIKSKNWRGIRRTSPHYVKFYWMFVKFLYAKSYNLLLFGSFLDYQYFTLKDLFAPYHSFRLDHTNEQIEGILCVGAVACCIVVLIRQIKYQLKIRDCLYYILWSIGMFLTTFATLYKQCGLYSTHCAPGDVACLSTPLHDGIISLYFSAITMTTVGYGDFIPATNFVRALAAFEAFSGYFFMATIFALIISIFIPKKMPLTDDWS